jgi:nuclear pore complex protein Nup107
LLQALYTERTSPSPASSSSNTTDPFYYTPPLTLVQSAIAASPALSELSVVKDWLHSTAYSRLHPAEVRKGYLTYTKNKLKQALRTGGNKADLGSLVDTLDPDATNRKDSQGKRKNLDPEDAGYEKALLRSLWEYVRVGELDQALDMCRQSDSSWRAASLSGGKLYSNDTLARARAAVIADTDGEETMDIPAATDGKLVQGNIRRKLWKSTCKAIADSEHVYTYERALYGAISGQTKSVLPVCETWEDYLWVHVNSLLEQEIDSILESNANTNYFLSSSSAASEEISASSSEQQPTEHKSVPQALQNIFNMLLSEPKLRLDSRSPFHVAQSWIILNKTNDLLNTFVTKLEENAESLDEPYV